MEAVWTYWLAITGSSTVSVDIPLNPARRYLVTGGLILTDGDDYARVYISTLCRRTASDLILCGVRDAEGDAGLGVTEFLAANAVSVTIKLKTTGGKHRAEGVVYEL
jgi:hypothetical protein